MPALPSPSDYASIMDVPQFSLLPREIQLFIWKYAFLNGPLQERSPILIGTKTSLTNAFHNPRTLRRKANAQARETCFRSNTCLVGRWQLGVHDHRAEKPVHRLTASPTEVALVGEGSGSKYRIVLFRGTELASLMECCSLARLGVLEAWKICLEDRVAEDERRKDLYREYHGTQHGRGYSGILPSAHERKILDVVGKVLEQLRSG